MYRALRAEKIVDTVKALQARIAARFPGSGLSKVCHDLIGIAEQTSARIADVDRPHWGIRLSLAAAIGAGLAGLIYLAANGLALKGSDELTEILQGLDSAVNLLVIIGGAVFFLSTIETRWKRNRALTALHELRAIVHVIDMHQLTKDPSMIGQARMSTSPDRELSPFELKRYLDYCSEMLSLTAKLAALYAERLSDAVVVDTVGDIERLTSDLSNKIWQKITMVQGLEGRNAPSPSPQSFIPSA
ncbi:MAG: hypothetical protein ACKVP4_00500 [Hyphomicrobium sp.]